MNNINVPADFKYLVKRERNGRDYNEACIRDYVIAHPNQVISGQDFMDALDGLTTASTLVRQLVKKGRLVRKSVKNGQRGHAYSYTWVVGGAVPTIKANGEVVLTKPRTGYATAYELKRLNEWFLDYCADHSESIPNVNDFRMFVIKKTEGEENASTEKTEV
jgi:hypothetical protein